MNPIVHVRFEGLSQDIPFSELDIGQFSSDEEIRRAVAHYLGISQYILSSYIIERHTINITIRPEAVFG